MLAEHRQYLLPEGCGLHAKVTVIPTGELEVNILEEDNHYKGEFDELYFYSAGKKTELVCKDQLKPENIRWHLCLTSDDARELAKLIELAEEEFEILMRDL
ncbi:MULTISPECIES: hypothetical protein [Photobacterium]|uniref:Uncharacterized protein n=1 Tax=Photobacterium ganghwense TaxID=320778 RepID=A0A0J1HFA9_9GAMM|nr:MULTISPECIES: hypothetical protein [Photobacterium]KLV10308.1 hypothetical protein ABT57_07035 [Photobacterium ganghwense]MBV1841984.1 hypothetical protein [Photobacterium ganghwense]PSU09804.1 hypothetical protein C9I92_09865 [Photobacterium ganghwense]QSV17050.1 hypothetical protein FH974_19085 [Photobacterium ganghwense]